MEHTYLTSTIKQFLYYKSLGDKTFEQLSFDQIQWEHTENVNSIAIISKHIIGNMLSRWTHFLTEDGEKEWRNRDQEFIDSYQNKEELLDAWQNAWNCLFDAIEPLEHKDLERVVYIRNQGHSITEAINRQLAHYAYHIGQIVFIGKILKKEKWQSLSIPKGDSQNYNKDKFSKEKGRRHFTDDL